MERRRTLGAAGVVTAIALVMAVAFAPTAGAVSPDPNPWLQNRFLNMAHQGGEDEAPSNTLFAFKSAIHDRGADSLELDVNLSSDAQLMVIHDDTWTRIACTQALCPGPDSSTEKHRPDSEVNDLTKDQLQALDAGYWFRPGTYSHDYSLPDSDYPYRGIATGEVPPPTGYSASDFRIPTLREVLDAFPDTPINIEIKLVKIEGGVDGGCTTDNGIQYCDDVQASMPVADALADLLDESQYASRTDIIVVSFGDELLDEFHAQDAGGNVALAPGVDDTTAFGLAGTIPDPDVAAFQVPPSQTVSGIPIDVPQLLLQTRHAHELGYAVHVWTNGDQDETDASYQHLYDLGVDGIMSSVPSRLAAFLCANHIPRPDGSDRCPGPPSGASQAPSTSKCRKGKHSKRGICVPKKCRKHKVRSSRRCVVPKHWKARHGGSAAARA
jgi:glycerophosphoryl diester phosphodiesterase